MKDHGIKVSNSNPPSKGKGHRSYKTGPVRSNAKGPGYPSAEAPWPEAKAKKLS